MNRRLSLITTAATLAALATVSLSACTGLRTLSSDVSSYGEWPADRKPGSYAFERLPSQQARAAEADALEAQASAALAKAGFKPADAGQQPDVLVQVASRDERAARDPWDDPLWWRGSHGFWGYGPWMAPRWGGMGVHGWRGAPRYDREVAVLIRDRASGKPVYETHASSEGNLRSDGPLLAAMFEAALTDFPKLGVNPRRVDVVMPQ